MISIRVGFFSHSPEFKKKISTYKDAYNKPAVCNSVISDGGKKVLLKVASKFKILRVLLLRVCGVNDDLLVRADSE